MSEPPWWPGVALRVRKKRSLFFRASNAFRDSPPGFQGQSKVTSQGDVPKTAMLLGCQQVLPLRNRMYCSRGLPTCQVFQNKTSTQCCRTLIKMTKSVLSTAKQTGGRVGGAVWGQRSVAAVAKEAGFNGGDSERRRFFGIAPPHPPQ